MNTFDIKNHFEKNAIQYVENVTPLYKTSYDYITQYAKNRGVFRIADIACGDGQLSINLAQHLNCNVVGIDQSKNLIHIAKSKNPDISWIIGNVEYIPMIHKSFDLVICNLAINLFSKPHISLNEMKRIVSTTGEIIISALTNIEFGKNISSKMSEEILQKTIYESNLKIKTHKTLSTHHIIKDQHVLTKLLEGAIGPWHASNSLTNFSRLVSGIINKSNHHLELHLKIEVYHLIQHSKNKS